MTATEIENIIFNAPVYDRTQLASLLQGAEKKNLSDFFRGDNRDNIRETGFSAWNTAYTPEQMRRLMAYMFVNRQFAKDFFNWWKYPGARTLADRQIPFIATGLQDCHLGKYEYKIHFPSFTFYRIPQLGIFKMWIGFNGSSLETSDHMAIQVDASEAIFGTSIPSTCIL